MVTRQLRAEYAPHSFLDINPRQLLREQEFFPLIIYLSLLEIVWKMPYVVVPLLFGCTEWDLWQEFCPQCADVGRWDRTIAVWSLTDLWGIVGGITLKGTDVAVMRPQVVLIKDRHKTQQS